MEHKRRKIENEEDCGPSAIQNNSSNFGAFCNEGRTISTFETQKEAFLFCIYKISSKKQKIFDYEKISQMKIEEMNQYFITENNSLDKNEQIFVRPLKPVTQDQMLLKFAKSIHENFENETKVNSDNKKMEIEENQVQSSKNGQKKRKREIFEDKENKTQTEEIAVFFPKNREISPLDLIFEAELNYCEGNIKKKDYQHSKQIFERLVRLNHAPSKYYLGKERTFCFY